MIYLASPYSHPDPEVREQRYLKAVDCIVDHMKELLAIYSPIVHWHEAAKRHSLPTDAASWELQNKTMLEHAALLTVLTIPGWEESLGVQQEIAWARELNKTILYFPVNTL